MRVAICLSGYFRKYYEIYQNFNDKIIDFNRKNGHQIDIFASTYDELNSSNCFSCKEGVNTDYHGNFNSDDIIKKYDIKKINVENFEKVKSLFNIKNFIPDIDLSSINPNIHKDGHLFGLSMHYQRYKTNQLKLQTEAKEGFKYDLTLICRPDVFFLEPLNFSDINPDSLYSMKIYYDYFFVSSSENIDKMCEVWLNIQNIVDEHKVPFDNFPLYVPEYFLEHFLSDIGLSVQNNKRQSIPEGSCLIYPKRDFFSTLSHCVLAINKPSIYQEISKFNLTNLN